MRTYKNDPRFKAYIQEAELYIPELSNAEIDLLKQYYRLGLSVKEAVQDMCNFDKNKGNEPYKRLHVRLQITDIKKHNSDFDFEEVEDDDI